MDKNRLSSFGFQGAPDVNASNRRPLAVRGLFLAIFSIIVLLALLPQTALAQGGPANPQALAGQSLRGYTHVFIAYSIAWVMVFGWVVSIARRLGRVEKALNE